MKRGVTGLMTQESDTEIPPPPFHACERSKFCRGLARHGLVVDRCRAGAIFDARPAGQFGRQMWRNEVAKLAENGEFSCVGLDSIFLCLPCGKEQPFRPTFFIPQPPTLWDSNEDIFYFDLYGMLVDRSGSIASAVDS
jgi:hypothetical protein